jgi:hypothetical protein
VPEQRAAWNQGDFRGGEWSKRAQGRVSDPAYRTALNLCRNAYPLEDGNWSRRTGFRHLGYSHRGYQHRLVRLGGELPMVMEMSFDGSSASFARFWNGPNLVTDSTKTVSSFSAATPSVVTTSTNHGWSTGDDVIFTFSQTNAAANNTVYGQVLQHVVCTITVTGVTTFTIKDAISTTSIAGGGVTMDTATVSRINRVSLPYTQWYDVWTTQVIAMPNSQWLLLSGANRASAGAGPGYQPRLLTMNHLTLYPVGTPPYATADFSIATQQFDDGPYRDPEGGAATASAATGSITLDIASPLVNDGTGFSASDIGRCVRFLSTPAAWSSGTSYSAGDQVALGTYPNAEYYVALVANSASQPDHFSTLWTTLSTGINWTWGRITAVTDTDTVTVSIQGPDIAYRTNIVQCQLDAYNAYRGWPRCGTIHDGRLWLGQFERLDASVSNDPFNMQLTSPNGQPGAADAISYIVSDPEGQSFTWMYSDISGIVAGLGRYEWLINASPSDEALTPQNINARKISSHGSSIIEAPIRVGQVRAMVQRASTKIMEFYGDSLSGKYTAHCLTDNVHHLVGFGRLAYQTAPTPFIWAYSSDGLIYGCTYRRSSLYSTSPPEFNAWHRHSLGTSWQVTEIAVGPGWALDTLTGDTLWIASYDGSKYHVEMLMDPFDANRTAIDGWFLDSAITPSDITALTNTSSTLVPSAFANNLGLNSTSSITFHGLRHLVGSTVTAFICGLDCGSYTVVADGTNGKITVPYGADSDGLFTSAYLIANSSLTNFNGAGAALLVRDSGGSTTTVYVPVVLGVKYLSEGQGVRPNALPDVHTIGPSLAMTRRVHRFGFLLDQSGIFNYGTDSTHTYVATFRAADDQTAITTSTMFTGVYWDLADDNPSFDGMVYWNTNTVYPLNIAAATSFLVTSEL